VILESFHCGNFLSLSCCCGVAQMALFTGYCLVYYVLLHADVIFSFPFFTSQLVSVSLYVFCVLDWNGRWMKARGHVRSFCYHEFLAALLGHHAHRNAQSL
jgi:hypothetical protein